MVGVGCTVAPAAAPGLRKGLQNSRQARWKHGRYSAARKRLRRQLSWVREFAKVLSRLDEGPNFIRLPDGGLWASARRYHADGATTVLARMTPESYEPVLILPSGSDNSYPGMVWHDNLLWMSYYSSHEEKTSIYLAKIRFS